MAGDGGDGDRRVDGRLSEKVQAQLGILAIPAEQRAVDRLGRARSRLRTHLPSALSRISEHSRRGKEPSAIAPGQLPMKALRRVQKLHGDSSAGTFGGPLSTNLIDCRRSSAITISTCRGVMPTPG